MMAAAALAGSANAQILYSNGGLAELSTGPLTRSGVTNVVGGEWSEVPDDSQFLAHNSAGNNCGTTFRIAEDFTVPSGQTWTVNQVELYLYQTSAVVPSINSATIAIYTQDPQINATPAFGSTTTNVFASAAGSNLYRIFNTFLNGSCSGSSPGTTRRIQTVTCNVNFVLPAGTYWIDWGAAGTSTSGPWTPQLPKKPAGSGITYPNANALQGSGGVFGPALAPLRDGTGPTCVITANTDPMEYPFTLKGTSSGGCRPDLTTGAIAGQPGYGVPNGILNNDDFFYYLAQFAAGNLAVADLTTGAIVGQPGYGVPNGVLNNDDFFYYLAIFAAGC